MKTFLNASEVAKILRVDRATVSRWLKNGKIKGAIRPDNAHQWRIPMSAVEDLMKGSSTNNESS